MYCGAFLPCLPCLVSRVSCRWVGRWCRAVPIGGGGDVGAVPCGESVRVSLCVSCAVCCSLTGWLVRSTGVFLLRSFVCILLSGVFSSRACACDVWGGRLFDLLSILFRALPWVRAVSGDGDARELAARGARGGPPVRVVAAGPGAGSDRPPDGGGREPRVFHLRGFAH
jgi:hypothetical protein